MSITRVLSALVLILVVGGTVWWLPPVATAMLAAVVAGIAAVELGLLVKPLGAHVPQQATVFAAAAISLAVSGAMSFTPFEPDAPIVMVIVFMILLGTIALTFAPGMPVFLSIAVMLLAVVYVGVPLGTLAWVRVIAGPAALTWLVGVIAVSDSAQYYAGTLFGRRKLAPVISPKKTIEGAIGGLVAAPLVGWAIGLWAMPGRPLIQVAGLSIVLAVAGIAGDLFESLLKRSVGAKDSSSLIPGHGGVLDRVDAYLFAAPVYYVYLRYLA